MTPLMPIPAAIDPATTCNGFTAHSWQEQKVCQQLLAAKSLPQGQWLQGFGPLNAMIARSQLQELILCKHSTEQMQAL